MAKKITGRHCLKLPLMCLIICAWQAGSCRLFGSAPLKGLGMAFRIEIVKKYGWPATSMVEDQELSLLLEQDNIAVHYNPQDIIRSAMKSDAAVAEKQRVRWEDGRFGLIEKYAPVFFVKYVKGNGSFFQHLWSVSFRLFHFLFFVMGCWLSWSMFFFLLPC